MNENPVTPEPDKKAGQVRFFQITELKPAPENVTLYKPVDPNDPDVQALAESIRQFGIREPLTVSQDGYIISGHRRYVAAQLAGLNAVPCLIIQISHDNPEFLRLLREANRQRVKTIDEVAREEVVSANPEEAHRALVAHRQRQAHPQSWDYEKESV